MNKQIGINCPVKSALEKVKEKHRFELLQQEKRLLDINNVVDELKRKNEQLSSQLRAEIDVLDFEKNLRQKFPSDNITSVADKGVINEVDVIQEVFDGEKNKCGVILWKIKKTNSFSKSWLQKLREDQRKTGANIAILVSSTLPKGSPDIELVEDVFVMRLVVAIPFSFSFRNLLL